MAPTVSAAGRSEAGGANGAGRGRRSGHKLLEGGKTLASAAHSGVLGAAAQPLDPSPSCTVLQADLANAAKGPCLGVCKWSWDHCGPCWV